MNKVCLSIEKKIFGFIRNHCYTISNRFIPVIIYQSTIKHILIVAAVAFLFSACKKHDGIPPVDAGNNSDTAGPLKSATNIPIGFAVNYNSFLNNGLYRSVVIREASSITFENEMKHSSIVRSDGTYNFTTADAFVNAASSAGLSIFGHTLGWHTQQNATYLKTFSGMIAPSTTELLANPGFEAGGTATLESWSIFNAQNGATITVGTGTTEVRSGSRSMKVVNPVSNAEHWRVQVASELINTTANRQYIVSYWVKAASPGGSIRLSTQTAGGGSAQYQNDQTIGTAWQQISWTFTANAPQTRILFDMGLVANTYYIDDVSLREATSASSEQIAAKLDHALKDWITTIVTRYRDKVKAWDVVNELFAENGNLRNNSNTSTAGSDVLVWSHYLGREYAVKAFNYAKAADPNALLFINDYNLEANNTAKLDSLVAYVKELQSKGVKIDGIGTQMHISLNTGYSAIDNMFRKLASTGLKVRISELDIRINPGDRADFTLNAAVLAEQSAMYHFVISSYLKNVPAAQQHGITFWGVDDPGSWIVTYMRKIDYPLLFDKDFNKKPAYYGVLRALKGK